MERNAAPTPAGERYGVLDVARGFALIGVLFANLPFHHSRPPWTLQDSISGWNDATAERVIGALFVGKSYPLLAFLFGCGFALMHARLTRDGGAWAGPHYRRAAGLMVLGLVHAFLVFEGDILYAYGLAALLLPAFAKASVKTMLWWVLGLYLIAIPIAAGFGVLQLVGAGAVTPAETSVELFLERVTTLITVVFVTPFYVLELIALMVLGMAVIKGGWLSADPATEPLRRRIRLYCTPVVVVFGGVGGWVFNDLARTFPDWAFVLAAAGRTAVGPFAALAIIAWTHKVMPTRALSPVRKAFEAVGRLSLSNYLGQSIVFAALFSAPGLGLAAKLPLTYCVAIGLIVFVAMTGASLLWLRAFRIGPFEWLLRAVTYMKAPRLTR